MTFTEDSNTSAGEDFELFFLYSLDDSTDEDGSASVHPDKLPEVDFEMKGSAGARRQCKVGLEVPPLNFVPLLWNASSSGNLTVCTLNLRFYDERYV